MGCCHSLEGNLGSGCLIRIPNTCHGEQLKAFYTFSHIRGNNSGAVGVIIVNSLQS